MTMDWALHQRDDIDYICQEKKDEEDVPTLWIAQMHIYESRTTLKRPKKD